VEYFETFYAVASPRSGAKGAQNYMRRFCHTQNDMENTVNSIQLW